MAVVDEMRAEFNGWVNDRGCDTDGAWSAWQACWNLLHAHGATEKHYHRLAQTIGHELGLPAGADVFVDVIPVVRKLRAPRACVGCGIINGHAPGCAHAARLYRCIKCGYKGPEQVNHQRPNGTGECGYIAHVVDGGREAHAPLRLLDSGDTIQFGDELVSDCGTAWLPVPKWAVGMEYVPGTFNVMRRTVGVTPKGEQQ
jgi:predicted RNA-binding Zn-ribbon protein involved in translation (DUF1610 family)